MIGTSSVGKTSLVARFVHSIFTDKYLTTVGVKIDKKALPSMDGRVAWSIWDLAGDDDFQRLQMSYLRGTSGYLFVADGTRAITLDQTHRHPRTHRRGGRPGPVRPRLEQSRPGSPLGSRCRAQSTI